MRPEPTDAANDWASGAEMNADNARWFRRYQTALRRYLRQGPSASLRPALRLGCQAVDLGLETLDVARVQEQVLTTLASPSSSSGTTRQRLTKRAAIFFAEAIVPIEANHRTALTSDVRIDRLMQSLRRRTKESSASAGQLQRAIAQRQAAEAALKKSTDHHAELLADAHGLEKQLRHQLREILSAQEEDREKTSRELRNEIAQSLLAIDLSLLVLKTSAEANTERVEKVIANAQRLVEQSR